MAKQLSVLYVTTEAYPFIKVSGLGDIAFSFPLAMRELGFDMRLMIPRYGCVSERKNRIHEINRLKDMQIKMNEVTELTTIKSSSINNPRAKVQAYITTNYNYFDSRKGVYHDIKTNEKYPDDAERFIFFCKTVIQTCITLGWYPDIIHCNDWRTALIAAYVKVLYPNKFKKTKVVLTVHNFAHQGIIKDSDIVLTDLPKEVVPNFKHKGLFNFLRGGIYYSDFVTTVSPSYAEEVLKNKEMSDGLNAILKQNKNKFKGILNGIDNWVWNPACDDKIDYKLSGDVETFKKKNKEALAKILGIKLNEDAPLIGMISRIDEQKGIPLFIDAADKIFKQNLNLILLGEGDNQLKKKIVKLEQKYSTKFKFISGFDDELAHKIEAASDMFLMPSLFEPCGLNLMYSLKYAAVPIVHFTGGIKDVAIPYDENTKTGNSFVFTEHSSKGLLDALKYALTLFKHKEQWENIIKNGINQDFSWSATAEQYADIYKQLLKD